MLDLLIISAPFTYTFGPSLGPALLKSCVMQKNISATAWDLSAEFNLHSNSPEYQSVTAWMLSPELKLTQHEFNWYQSLVIKYATKICDVYRPKNLAVSLLTLNSQRFVEDLCYHIRLLDPNIKILLGGSGLDIIQFQYQLPWHDLMLKAGLADTVILGEGEFSLAQAILQDQQGVIKVPQLSNAELDLIPIPDYDDYDFSLYETYTNSYWNTNESVKTKTELVFLITSSKGCVKNCSFCDVGKIWNKFRFRSAEKVAEEIIFLNQQYGANYFSFTDSLMNGGMKIFSQMNQLLAEKIPKTISYEGQIICRGPSDMPEKHFQSMSDAGCRRVIIGLESGSEKVRMSMGKDSSQEAVNYTTSMLIKYGIHQHWNIIAGYPTETAEDWQDTMNLIKHWLPKSNDLLRIDPISTFLLLDGTPLTNSHDYIDLELTISDINGYSGFAWVSSANPENTFDVRCERFLELCYYLIEYDSVTYANVHQKIKAIKKQLEWYRNEYKPKKTFNISVSKNSEGR